jgi:hypothetical protein
MLYFKRFSLLALLLGGFAVLEAQPTLQNNVFPSIGSAVTTAAATDSNAVSEGAAGANITWNFGGLLPDLETVTTSNFQSPTGTPYEPLYPASNLCAVIFDSINLYNYFQKTSTELNLLGFATQDFDLNYTNPQTVMKAPLSFGNSYTDTYRGSLDAGGILVSLSGEQESTYDAYGTLILPSGTYTNAIRVKTVSMDVDTVDFLGLLNISEITTTAYSWYVANQPGPLVTISYSEGVSISVIPPLPPTEEPIPLEKSITFTTDVSTGIAEVPALQADLAFRGANPVGDLLALDISMASAGQTLLLQIVGANGQVVAYQNVITNGATVPVDVNVAGLRPGVYFVSLTDGIARTTKGFVKM